MADDDVRSRFTDGIFRAGMLQLACKRIGKLAVLRTKRRYFVMHYETGAAFGYEWESATDALTAAAEIVEIADWDEFFREVATDREQPGPAAQIAERLRRIVAKTNGVQSGTGREMGYAEIADRLDKTKSAQ